MQRFSGTRTIPGQEIKCVGLDLRYLRWLRDRWEFPDLWFKLCTDSGELGRGFSTRRNRARSDLMSVFPSQAKLVLK